MASTASSIISGPKGSTYSIRSATSPQCHITQACGAAAASTQSQSARLGRCFGDRSGKAG